MIQPSAAYSAANAKLAKKPIWLVLIDDYPRVFTSARGITGTPSSPVTGPTLVQSNIRQNAGGLSAKPTDVALPAGKAGNVVFAWFNNWFPNAGGAPTISDSAGWTWHLIVSDNNSNGTGNVGFGLWWAISNGNANDITFHTGDASAQWIDMWVGEFEGLDSSLFATHNVVGHGSGTYTLDGASVTYSGNDDIVLIDNPVTSGLQWLLVFIGNGSISPAGNSYLPVPQITAGLLSTNGINTTAFEWLVSIDDLKITISDLDGSSDLADLVFHVQDRGQQITADLAAYTFEGKTCRLLEGFAGMAVSDYLTRFTGTIDTVESDNNNNEYTFTVSDINIKKLTQKIYTTGDSGLPIDSKNPKTLLDHPLNILVNALEQAGVNASSIDTTKINFYRDTLYSGALFKFTLTSAPTAKDFLENEILKPLAMYLWPDNLGKLSINSFYPALSGNGSYTPPTPPVMTAVVSTNPSDVNQFNAPLVQEAELYNQVVFDFDDDGTGSSKFLSEQIVDLDASIAKYGLVGVQTIQSQGMRSTLQGYFLAFLVGMLICLRYGFKTLVLDPLPITWNGSVVQPGDIIAITNPFVPDRTLGVLGVTAKTFEVLDVNYRFMSGVCEIKALALDLSKFKEFLITPNAEAAYPSASPTDQAKYMFQCGTNDKYSTGAAANTLG